MCLAQGCWVGSQCSTQPGRHSGKAGWDSLVSPDPAALTDRNHFQLQSKSLSCKCQACDRGLTRSLILVKQGVRLDSSSSLKLCNSSVIAIIGVWNTYQDVCCMWVRSIAAHHSAPGMGSLMKERHWQRQCCYEAPPEQIAEMASPMTCSWI